MRMSLKRELDERDWEVEEEDDRGDSVKMPSFRGRDAHPTSDTFTIQDVGRPRVGVFLSLSSVNRRLSIPIFHLIEQRADELLLSFLVFHLIAHNFLCDIQCKD